MNQLTKVVDQLKRLKYKQLEKITQELQSIAYTKKRKASNDKRRRALKEFSKTKMDLIANEVALTLKAMEQSDHPENSLCSHHGYHLRIQKYLVALCEYSSTSRLRVGVELSDYFLPDGTHVEFSADQFVQLRDILAKKLNSEYIDSWNFSPTGISIVFKRNIPDSLKFAQNNKHPLASDVKYDNWVEHNKRKLNGKS